MKLVPIDPRKAPIGWEDLCFGGSGHTGTYTQQLLWTLDQCPDKPDKILEIGLGWGLSTLLWLTETEASVTVIELHPDDFERQPKVSDALTAYSDSSRLHIIYGEGAAVARILKPEYDFIFIDASHTYEDTLREIYTCWRIVKSGGVLAGHDISLPGVYKAVANFEQNLHIPIVRSTEFQDMGTWYGRKS